MRAIAGCPSVRAAAAFAGAGLAVSTASAQVTFIPLGSLPGYGASFEATISADGQWVAGSCYNPDTHLSVGFRWSQATGMQDIRDVTGTYSRTVAISADGVALTGSHQDPQDFTVAFRWRASDGVRDMGHIGSDLDTFGIALSNLGTVVIGEGDDGFTQFRWTQPTGIRQIFPLVPGDLVGLPAVSADGTVIVGFDDPGFPGVVRAVRSVNGGVLEALPSAFGFTEATAVSADGSVIAGHVTSASSQTPCIWTDGDGPYLLDRVAGWTQCATHAIGGDGTTVVGDGAGTATPGGFVWRRTLGAIDLQAYLASHGANVQGWSYFYPTGVDAAGTTIVGSGSHNGHLEVWLARFPAPLCYANCDGSSASPVLNIGDFVCFQAAFAAGDPNANCDGSTAAPTLNIADYVCFMARFVAGCE